VLHVSIKVETLPQTKQHDHVGRRLARHGHHKQQSGAGTAVSSNTGASTQITEPSSSNVPSSGPNFEPKIPSEIRSHTIPRGKHCGRCGLDHYYNSEIIEGNAETDAAYLMASKKLQNHLHPPLVQSFCGVTLDRSERGQLSEFHILENDGDTETLSQEWETMATQVGGPEVISSL